MSWPRALASCGVQWCLGAPHPMLQALTRAAGQIRKENFGIISVHLPVNKRAQRDARRPASDLGLKKQKDDEWGADDQSVLCVLKCQRAHVTSAYGLDKRKESMGWRARLGTPFTRHVPTHCCTQRRHAVMGGGRELIVQPAGGHCTAQQQGSRLKATCLGRNTLLRAQVAQLHCSPHAGELHTVSAGVVCQHL